MKIAAIVQARLGSTRLPNKVIKEIVGRPMIEILLTRLSQSKEINQIVVATSNKRENDNLKILVESLGYECIRGSENDVLSRFYRSAKKIGADVVLRITGDCPLVDSEMVDTCIKEFKSLAVDYYSNTMPATFPDGLDIEVMSFSSLERAHNETESIFDREHVTPYIRNSVTFSKGNLTNSEDLSKKRWTVDELEDFIVINRIFEYFYPNILFSWKDVYALQKNNPSFFREIKDLFAGEARTVDPRSIAAASAYEPCTTKCSPAIIIFPGAFVVNINMYHSTKIMDE